MQGDGVSEGKRRLAAVMFTDMVGYTALGQRNEELSLALVNEHRAVIRPVLARHGGREVKTMGDGFMVEFESVLDAVRCAYDIQRAVREFNLSLAEARRIHLRVGIHLGDVVEEAGDVSGDAVNVASRIEPLAPDGGVCVSKQVYDQVSNKLDIGFSSIGARALKNVREPVEVYRMVMPWEVRADRGQALAARAGGRGGAGGAGIPDERRVAVLPFVSMSPDPGDAYFADGLTEEVISTVANVSGLSVISRTSVMGYKGSAKNLRDIGRELEAGSVVEGSVRKAGARIRVTAQLIRVEGDEHLWAHTYDRQLDDVFEVQSDIAKQVAEALKVKIGARELERLEAKPTRNTEAYTAYLKGLHYMNRRVTPQEIRTAQEFFEQAVALDPEFALGYVGLATCHHVMRWDWSELSASEDDSKALSYASRALELDPGLAEAHATLGLLLLHQRRFRESDRELCEAIKAKPSYATAHHWRSIVRGIQLEFTDALAEIEEAARLDPNSAIILYNVAAVRFVARDFAGSLEAARKLVSLAPEYFQAHILLGMIYGRLGLRRESEASYRSAEELSRFTYGQAGEAVSQMIAKRAKAYTAYFGSDRGTLAELLPDLMAQAGKSPYMTAVEVAGFCFYLGRTDEGYAMLDRVPQLDQWNSVYFLGMEVFDPLRDEPRFKKMTERVRRGADG
jgi:adenylate cyclase